MHLSALGFLTSFLDDHSFLPSDVSKLQTIADTSTNSKTKGYWPP